MSRYYEMCIMVRDREDALYVGLDGSRKAVREQWNVEDELDNGVDADNFFSYAFVGEGNLAGGETEEEFTDRVAAAIWGAYGDFCGIEVAATFLEDLPHERHCRERDDYERWMKT